MIRTLVKHGNSVALVLEKPILDLMNLKEGDKVEIHHDNGKLTIEPILKEGFATIAKLLRGTSVMLKHAGGWTDEQVMQCLADFKVTVEDIDRFMREAESLDPIVEEKEPESDIGDFDLTAYL